MLLPFSCLLCLELCATSPKHTIDQIPSYIDTNTIGTDIAGGHVANALNVLHYITARLVKQGFLANYNLLIYLHIRIILYYVLPSFFSLSATDLVGVGKDGISDCYVTVSNSSIMMSLLTP